MRNIVYVVLLIAMLFSVPAASAALSVEDSAGLGAASQIGDPAQLALDHIRYNAAALGLTADDVADLVVTDSYTSEHVGVAHVYLRQRYNGIEVVGANANLNILPDGSIQSLHHSFVPNLADAINREHPALDPVEATESAADAKGLGEPQDLEVVDAVGGVEQEVVLSEGGISQEPIPAKLVYAIAGPGDVRLSWQMDIFEMSGENYWNLQVDAETGEVLGEANYVSHLDDQYEVYALPTENPDAGPRSIVVNPADPTASPFGWHDTNGAAGAEFTITRGNNAHAYQDQDSDNTPEVGETPDGGATLDFTGALVPLNLANDPLTYVNASVTNLFYWTNIIHDVLYQYGFNEVAGNFQVNNYGNGGLGNDAVLAEAQDGTGSNNAQFFSFPDGQAPRMQMYLWNQTSPRRDGSLEATIITHEYGHGVSNRLTGGPATVSCLSNLEQMGEGWSDFLGLALTAKASHTALTTRGMGNYSLGQPVTGGGIRPAPYTTDLGVNAYTYANLSGMAAPHGVGFVWATMLWDMYWVLVNQHGYNPNLYEDWTTGGNNLALQLVLDGMKLQPCSPGFVDGRNAILQADTNLTGGANQCFIWEAFARRGLGSSASQGSSSSPADGTAAFDMPLACAGVDSFAPKASILINGGLGLTTTANVDLSLSATDDNGLVDRYFLADTQLGLDTATAIDVPDADNWVDVVPYVLPDGNGLKTVWLRVCDVAENCVDASDSILLDSNAIVNTTTINIGPSANQGDPYPSIITVSGLVGEVVKVTVGLWGVSHTHPEDMDVLLVGPTGLALFLMSDPGSGHDVVNQDFIFAVDADGPVPCGDVPVPGGTYTPTNCDDIQGNDDMPVPAPPGPYGISLEQYLGAVNPNGDWLLFARDDRHPDGGSISGGWSLSIETALTGGSYQGCLYAGTFKQVSMLPDGESTSVTCARGEAISLYKGTDIWACLYAGSLSQVGPTQPSTCGRGELIGFWAGADIWACLYAGTLSQVGSAQPANCGRGAPVGFVRIN